MIIGQIFQSARPRTFQHISIMYRQSQSLKTENTLYNAQNKKIYNLPNNN